MSSSGKRTKKGDVVYATDLDFHHLRHTAGAALVEAGINEATAGAILGHSGGSVTRRYSHASLTAMRTALELVEQTFLREAA